MRTRCFSELRRLETFEERFDYLVLAGQVGDATFGFDRWMNQQFYRSAQWQQARQIVIVRDNACDLGVLGYEIHYGLVVHHMNPITSGDLIEGNDWLLNPEFLVCTTQRTHNAIHFGGDSLLPKRTPERTPGDTTLW